MEKAIGDHTGNEEARRFNGNRFQPPPLNQLSTSSRKLKTIATFVFEIFLQFMFMVIRTLYSVLCNPVVWFVMKIVCSALSEIFIYIVLGVCSIIISVITQIDEYYSKNSPDKKNQEKSQLNPDNTNEGATYLFTAKPKTCKYFSEEESITKRF